MNTETLAQLFHETYERRASEFGYETRQATAIPWEEIPADNANKRLMIAVAGDVLAAIDGEATDLRALIADYDAYLTKIAPYSYAARRAQAMSLRARRVALLGTPSATEGQGNGRS